MPQLTTLDLQYVSPQLLKARSLELAVPGSWARSAFYIFINCIQVHTNLGDLLFELRALRLNCPLLHLNKGLGDCPSRVATVEITNMFSKARYLFVLYAMEIDRLLGHEDLRQDERVMQLFSLVNTLLSVDTNSFKRRLHIQRYPVIPLAPNAGLIGWVQDSDTLHVLIRDYRESRKVLLNIEYRLMLQVSFMLLRFMVHLN